MNAYLRTDSYTTTEKLVVSHMLQVFCMGIRWKTKTPATANIRFSKKIGFKVFSNLKINLSKKKKQEVD